MRRILVVLPLFVLLAAALLVLSAPALAAFTIHPYSPTAEVGTRVLAGSAVTFQYTLDGDQTPIPPTGVSAVVWVYHDRSGRLVAEIPCTMVAGTGVRQLPQSWPCALKPGQYVWLLWPTFGDPQVGYTSYFSSPFRVVKRL